MIESIDDLLPCVDKHVTIAFRVHGQTDAFRRWARAWLARTDVSQASAMEQFVDRSVDALRSRRKEAGYQQSLQRGEPHDPPAPWLVHYLASQAAGAAMQYVRYGGTFGRKDEGEGKRK
jgi:hypothetical protein